MTPFEITFLLHVYAIGEPFEYEGTPAGRSTVSYFLDQDLITRNPKSHSGYSVTRKGLAYVDALKSIPLPVAVWTIPDK